MGLPQKKTKEGEENRSKACTTNGAIQKKKTRKKKTTKKQKTKQMKKKKKKMQGQDTENGRLRAERGTHIRSFSQERHSGACQMSYELPHETHMRVSVLRRDFGFCTLHSDRCTHKAVSQACTCQASQGG